jgi:hypothetical protein
MNKINKIFSHSPASSFIVESDNASILLQINILKSHDLLSYVGSYKMFTILSLTYIVVT